MNNKKKKNNTTQLYNNTNSPEPNDGTFINKNPLDSFSSEGTVRYGEETDVDDL